MNSRSYEVIRSLGLLIFLMTSACAYAQTDSLCSEEKVLSTGLPLVKLNTIGGEDPKCDFVFAPEGCMSVSITNCTKVPGRVLILKQKRENTSTENKIDTLFDSGEYKADSCGMTLKIRGNTSAYYQQSSGKYPYKIKLEKKADMLCRGDKVYKDKEWALLNSTGSFNNTAGRYLSKIMKFPYTAESEYVNVILNDKYKGVYLLSETVKRNADCRLNVDKDNGYIIEHDPYWWNETVSFGDTSQLKFRYTFNYPDDKDLTDDQMTYISTAVKEMEDNIKSGTYDEFINVSSFARWLLAEDILGAKDGGGVNLYLAKYSNTSESKFETPVLWDFDSSFSTPNAWSNLRGRFLFQTLLDSNNRNFAKEYKSLWQNYGHQYCMQLLDSLKEYRNKEEFSTLEPAFYLEWETFLKGDYEYETLDSLIEECEVWFPDRIKWLDENIEKIAIEDGIYEVSNKEIAENRMYDLLGRQLLYVPKNGIYIKNGRKYIK